VSSARFYAELPVFTDFGDVSRPESFAPLPDDWHVVMSDVRNSTVAVQSGSYKNVNTLGAATITAVLNAAGAVEIPFVFEGDGSVLCSGRRSWRANPSTSSYASPRCRLRASARPGSRSWSPATASRRTTSRRFSRAAASRTPTA
jgi:hypothetical protein